MTSQPTPVRIPLVEISGKVEQDGRAEELPQGLKRISEVEISVPQGLPEQCYALEMPNIVKESVKPEDLLGIFRPGMEGAALNDIYVLGLVGREPLICKVIKNDGRSGSSHQGEPSQIGSSSRVKNRRKSFMTPTPLHIPESRVSPIPDSAHEMIYLKGLGENETLKVIPLRDVVWMHPLIAVVENPER
jgi:hypothetical protein